MNEYLEQEYCDEHNRRFAVDAASEVDDHLPAPRADKLREIFRLETERRLGNDWVVRHDNRFYQVEGRSRNYAPAQSKVLVCVWEDERMEIHYRGRKLSFHEIPERGQKPQAVKKSRRPHTPAAAHMPDHPWRRSYQDMQARRAPSRGVVGSISVASASAPP
jgi:hypothetical protein